MALLKNASVDITVDEKAVFIAVNVWCESTRRKEMNSRKIKGKKRCVLPGMNSLQQISS
jgi:hypothetical protein